VARFLVDATDFFLRDLTAAQLLRPATTARSHTQRVLLPNTRNFPKNTEVDVMLTFVNEQPAAVARRWRPDPGPAAIGAKVAAAAGRSRRRLCSRAASPA
jgi:hypothetical protein